LGVPQSVYHPNEEVGLFWAGVRVLSFRNVSVGETAAQSLSTGMRRGQKSSADTLLKRPAREPWPPTHRAYAPEGTEEKPILFKEI